MNSFPLLGELCRKHHITRKVSEESPSDCKSSSDDSFTMPLHAKDNKDDLNSFGDCISTKASPVKYQVNSTQIHDLSSCSLKYHKELPWTGDRHSAASDIDIPSDLSLLVDAYKASGAKNKTIIVLSAIPSDKNLCIISNVHCTL